MLRIGEFSKLTKTTVKTLRYYDKLGLLKPAFVDDETLYRYYLPEQIATAQKIQIFKSAGLSCESIRKILQNEKDAAPLLLKHRQELEALRDQIDLQIVKLDCLMDGKETQLYSPKITNIDAYTVFYSRSFIEDVSGIMSFIKQSMHEFKRTNPNVSFSSPDYCCIIYPDESYRERNVFVEYAQSVECIGKDTPVIKFKTLEAVTAVSVTHFGGYENLRDAYLSAVTYAMENGYEICGNARERYLKGAWNCEDKEKWETVVQLPVKAEADRR